MGLGSYFLMINASPWNLTKIDESAYQMNTWEWPSVFTPGKLVTLCTTSV